MCSSCKKHARYSKANSMIGDEIYENLSRIHKINIDDFVAPKLSSVPLFEFIVAVVLSQNTSDKNAWRAYANLKKKLQVITPQAVIEMGVDELSSSIRVAGMHKQRSLKLIELAKIFVERNIENALTNYVKSGRYDEARKLLIDLPGVGDKTADVVLLMRYGVPTFPVDTHIMRITLRLGFVNKKNYELVRSFWMKNTSPRYYLPLHLLLITHGRKTCRSRSPLCSECAIRRYCRYPAEDAK
ncbi:MAG: endonuclease III [Desulfurococcaceae archaeon]